MHTSQRRSGDGSGEKTRVPNRWGEGRRLRQEILDAADRLLQGEIRHPEDISLRAIAREAGISAPSIYKHFKDKSELLWAVLDGVYAELAENLRAAARSAPPGDAWAALRACVDAYSRFATQHRQRYQLMFHIGPTLPDRLPRAEHPINQLLDVWHDIVQAYLTDPATPSGRSAAADSLTALELSRLLSTGLHGQFGVWWSVAHDDPPQELMDLREALLFSLFGRR